MNHAFKDEIGILKRRFSQDGRTWRLVRYHDGEVWLTSLDHCKQVSIDDPMHLDHSIFDFSLYCESKLTPLEQEVTS